MKRRKKLPVAGWKIVLAILIAAGIATVGISYAKWTDNLQVTGRVTTGALDMVFQEDSPERYTVGIFDVKSSALKTFNNCKINIAGEGKSAEISFEGFLPLEELIAGKYLKFSYPIKSGKGTLNLLKQEEADFSEPCRTVIFKPLSHFAVLDGQKYAMDDLTADYALPLEFNVYRALECSKDKEYLGSVYLELTPESLELIAALPRILQIPASELPDGEENPEGGVAVLYEAAIPIALDQKPTTGN